METEVRDRPAFANILVKMDTGESIIAESDAMSMSASIKMKTRLMGAGKCFLRRFFGGEFLFINDHYRNI